MLASQFWVVTVHCSVFAMTLKTWCKNVAFVQYIENIASVAQIQTVVHALLFGDNPAHFEFFQIALHPLAPTIFKYPHSQHDRVYKVQVGCWTRGA